MAVLVAVAISVGAVGGTASGAATRERGGTAAPWWSSPGLGVPDHYGFAVDDVDEVRGLLAAATGTEFGPVTSVSKPMTFLEPSLQRKTVTIEESWSVRGGPAIQVVGASPAIGALQPDELYGSFFLSYEVDHVWLSSLPLLASGMSVVAARTNDFVFLKGSGGLLVRLIDEDLVPDTSGTNTPQAPMDLGAPVAVALASCDQAALADQIGSAFGIEWREPFNVVLPYEYNAEPGVTHLHESDLIISVPGPPFFAVEENLHAPPEYQCTPTDMNAHMTLLAEDVPAAAQQALAAGFPQIAHSPATSFHGAHGVYFEIAHVSLLEAVVGGP